MYKKSREYLDNLTGLLAQTAQTQDKEITAASEAVAACYAGGGMVYVFGTGHSHMLGLELFYRAGGFARVYPILEEGLMLHSGAFRSSAFERVEGYAKVLLDSYPVKKGDVMFVASNSGRNAVAIEMADEARKKGLTVVALTNMKHSLASPSRHSSGKKLFEMADIVIDNCGCVGDAAISFAAGSFAPTSTAVCAALLWEIMCGALEICEARGVPVEVYASSNVDGGGERNMKIIEKYSGVIKPL